MIATKAIALRLQAGSDEAGYLAQIFPLPKTPTIVIMKHGELKEYIASGTTKDDFLRRLATAFSAGKAAAHTPAPSTPAAPAAGAAAVSTPNVASPALQSSSQPSGSPESDGSENVRRILAERAAKAQKAAAAHQAKEVETAAATATSAAKGKGKAVVEAAAAPAQTDAQREATDLIKKKRAQQNDERRRILKRIEDDKATRRELAAHREKQREEGRAAAELEAKEQQQARAASRAGPNSASGVAAIQVRLSDGSSLRNKFQATENIKDIRTWVDKERSDGQGPYYFKQILTPLPSKNIDTTEEGKSLRELGLSPSSTLLLIPIQRFAAAYEAQCPSNGFFPRLLALLFSFFTWLMGLIGLGSAAPQPDVPAPSQQPANTAAALRNQRVQAFQNPNDRRGDQQLYNGNSVRALKICNDAASLTCRS